MVLGFCPAVQVHVLPSGIDLAEFRPMDRMAARQQLGCGGDASPWVLFSSLHGDSKAVKRFPLARAAFARLQTSLPGAQIKFLTGVPHERVPLWVNAANAVLVPSEREGFGLAVLEALACEVPVLATPVGIHRDALERVPGTLCAPFELDRWQAALEPHLREADPRVAGRASAERFSAHAMAVRVADAWRAALARSG